MQFLFEFKKNVIVSEIIVYRFMGTCRVLLRRKHATFDDSNVRFVLDQHAEIAFLFVVLHVSHLKGHTVKIQHSYFDC